MKSKIEKVSVLDFLCNVLFRPIRISMMVKILCIISCVSLFNLSVFAEVLVGTLSGDAAVDNTGTVSYGIPLAYPPGTSDMHPKLSISYSSKSGNSVLGVGFSLDGLSAISRVGATRIYDGLIDGVDFDEYDRFVLDGQRLMLISTNRAYGEDGSEYRTEIESFHKVVLHGDMNLPGSWFEVRTKSGLIYQYGHPSNSDSIVEPSNRPEAVLWMVNRISDTTGNYMDYFYNKNVADGEHTLDRIEYTGNTNSSPVLVPYNTVQFVYENRTDVRFRFMQGARFNTNKRLKRVEFKVEGVLAHQYNLEYVYSDAGNSLLSSVQQTFPNGDEIPRTLFRWTDYKSSQRFESNNDYAPPVDIVDGLGRDLGVRFLDLNGDGLADIVRHCSPDTADKKAYINTGSGWEDATADYAPERPISSSGGSDYGIRFQDVNGDGLVDMLKSCLAEGTGPDVASYLNTGSGWISDTDFIPPVYFTSMFHPGVSLDQGTIFLDINADGLVDILQNTVFSGAGAITNAYINSGTGWVQSDAYKPRSVVVNHTVSGLAFEDVNGDGLPDMLYRIADTKQGAYLNTGTNWSNVSSVDYEPPYPLHDMLGRDTGVNFADVNGDGLPDMLYHRIKPGQEVVYIHTETSEEISPETYENLPSPEQWLYFMVVRNIKITDKAAYLNTGTGWANESTADYEPPLILKEDGEAAKGVTFIDINGDGLVDIVYHNREGRGAWLNTGSGWRKDDSYAPKYPIVEKNGADLGSRFLDIDGDSVIDQVYSLSGASSGAHINKTGKIGLLKRAITGYRDNGHYNTITDLFYKPLTDTSVYVKGTNSVYPVFDIQTPMYVASEMAKDNGLGERYFSMYTYANARVHRDRGFLGFQMFESYDPQTQISQVETVAQDFPLTGARIKTETFYIPDPDADPELPGYRERLKEIENHYMYDIVNVGNPNIDYPIFIYVAKSTEQKWELGNTNDAIAEVTTYNWFDEQDASGNIPNLIQPASNFPADITYGEISKIILDYGNGSKQISLNTYNTNYVDEWILGRLEDATVVHVQDETNTVTKTASFEYYADTGSLATEISEAGSPVWLKTDYLYDAYGNITNKIISYEGTSNSVQRSIYDDKGRFVTETFNVLNHSETIITDPKTGLVTSKTGPNGLTSSWEYDSMGRVLLEHRPDGTQTETTYAWDYGTIVTAPPVPGSGGTASTSIAEFTVTKQTSGSSPEIKYFDHQERELRTVAETPSGKKVYVDTGYATNGQVYAMSESYFAGDDPNFGFTLYDNLGRPSIAIAPDGTRKAYGYNGLISYVTNNYIAGISSPSASTNQSSTTYKNAQGQVLKVVDDKGYEINYEYDAIGNLVKTIDQLSNTVVMVYDLRGKKIRQHDPDMGTWSYVYDALGQLTAQTNANGAVTTMEYDILGRLTKRITPEGTAQWYYDGNDEGCWIGGLRQEELRDTSGKLTYRRTFAYDELGRPLLNLYNIDNKWYYTCNTYDELSRPVFNYRFWRPHEIAGPEHTLSPEWNSFISINTYNERGALTKVSDGSGHVWWEFDEHDVDAKGNLLKYRYGNGVQTVNTYNDENGVLERTEAASKNAIGNDILAQSFKFDKIGNLTQRKDLFRGLQEDFNYDRLNRLTSSSVLGANENKTYEYNEIGNITRKGDITDYSYGATNLPGVVDAGVHAVTSADGVNYRYDDCGNMEARWVGTNKVATTGWSSFNKPLKMYDGLNGSEFTYGINNGRITQLTFNNGAVTKKLYLAGFEQEETLAVGEQSDGENRAHWEWDHKLTRIFIATPAGVVGTQVYDRNDAIKRNYFHKDHLGSIVAVSGEMNIETGNAPLLAEYSFDSWGKRRDATTWKDAVVDTSNLETDRGFTGHEMLDHLGLVHMNGRLYDAHLGRMVSADPNIPAPGNLQSYNRYSYVNNNPLSYTDPSGFFFKSFFRGVKTFFRKYWRVIVITIVAVVVNLLGSYYLGNTIGGGLSALVAGYVGSLLYGGNQDQALKQGWRAVWKGAVSGFLAGCLDSYYTAATKWLEFAKMAGLRGLAAGATELITGDSFKNGFVSGFMGALAGGSIILATILGGIASDMMGGSFANGAITAAAAAVAAAFVGYLSDVLTESTEDSSNLPQGVSGPNPGKDWKRFFTYEYWAQKITSEAEDLFKVPTYKVNEFDERPGINGPPPPAKPKIKDFLWIGKDFLNGLTSFREALSPGWRLALDITLVVIAVPALIYLGCYAVINASEFINEAIDDSHEVSISKRFGRFKPYLRFKMNARDFDMQDSILGVEYRFSW